MVNIEWMDERMDGGENSKHLHITKEVFPVHPVAFVFVWGVTFLRPRQTVEHTPSVPVIYRLPIDILQSETGGEHTHMPTSSMETLENAQVQEKRQNKPPAWADVNIAVMLKLACGNDFF